MTDETRGPVLPWPLDVAVFAPLGAAANLFDPKPAPGPDCVERGRHEVDVVLERVERSLQTAHGTGRLAVMFGVPVLQRSVADRIARVRGESVGSATPATPTAAWPEAETTNGATVEVQQDEPAVDRPERDVASLAIPGYDSLSASQVVEHLSGLGREELAAIGDYERANRNRRTILGKIDQLVAAS